MKDRVIGELTFTLEPGSWIIRKDDKIVGWWVHVDGAHGKATAVFDAAANRRIGMARTTPYAAELLRLSLKSADAR